MFARRVDASPLDRATLAASPGDASSPVGRKSKWQRFRHAQQQWWAYSGWQQATMVAVLVLCVVVVVVTATTAVTTTAGPPGNQRRAVRHTSVDVQHAQSAYDLAARELKRLEQASMTADRTLTNVYKQRTKVGTDEFERMVSLAKLVVSRAEDAVAAAARIADAKRTRRDDVARIFHHDRSLEEVDVYVAWAKLHISDYGALRVSRTPDVQPDGATERRPPRFLHALTNDLDVEDIKGLMPLHPALTCELMINGIEVCDTEYTTYIDCVLAYGLKVWSTVLLPQCSASSYWKSLARFLQSKFPRTADVGLLRRSNGADGGDAVKLSLMDKIQRASIPSSSPVLRETWGAVDPAHYSPPLQCFPASARGLPPHAAVHHIYPLSYGITSQYFSTTVTKRKLIDWYPILPALKPLTSRPVLPPGIAYRMSYSLGDVDEYLNTLLLRFSRFAWSHIRGGPDSMRHYEIMSQGTIPFFVDLDACIYKPCLSNLPKQLLKRATQLPGVEHIPLVNDSESSVRSPYFYRMSRQEVDATGESAKFTHVVNFVQRGDVDHTAFDTTAYDRLASEILTASRRVTSCASVVKSLLVRAGFASVQSVPRSILFVSFPHTDYITYTIECGMAELGLNYTVNYRFGTAYVDDDEHLMRPMHRNPNTTVRSTNGRAFVDSVLARRSAKSYGLGFATAQKINVPPNPIPPTQASLCSRVRGGEFDLYVVAWKSHRFLQDSCFEDAVSSIGKDRVLIVDGEDQDYLPNLTRYVLRGIKVFSREARCELLE